MEQELISLIYFIIKIIILVIGIKFGLFTRLYNLAAANPYLIIFLALFVFVFLGVDIINIWSVLI